MAIGDRQGRARSISLHTPLGDARNMVSAQSHLMSEIRYLDTGFEYSEQLHLMLRHQLGKSNQDACLQSHLTMVVHPISTRDLDME